MHDWPKCEETIHVELVSLAKCYVFRPIVKKLIGIKLVGYKNAYLFENVTKRTRSLDISTICCTRFLKDTWY